ncbi:MAG TPA: hypothetical protein VER55_12070 [Ardenticatenaceae bacterium]|nr:hypothetical protein [Ardenticatenaceae bacterium]
MVRPILLFVLLLALVPLPAAVLAAPPEQVPGCRYFSETGGYNVCDDASARFLTAFERWGLQRIGYPVSRRYIKDGFTMQAFQKAIMQWRPECACVVLANIFDDLHNAGFDPQLLETRQTPPQLPGDPPGTPFDQVVRAREGWLNARPALRSTYFSIADPLTFFGLPTSQVQDMGNHYAIRLQRAALQEWKENVPWARIAEVTIANGGDIAKGMGSLPADAIVPEAGTPAPTPPVTSQPTPSNCDPSYPHICIPPPPPDLDCEDIVFRHFQVLPPDPHDLDPDGNGVGCE